MIPYGIGLRFQHSFSAFSFGTSDIFVPLIHGWRVTLSMCFWEKSAEHQWAPRGRRFPWRKKATPPYNHSATNNERKTWHVYFIINQGEEARGFGQYAHLDLGRLRQGEDRGGDKRPHGRRDREFPDRCAQG